MLKIATAIVIVVGAEAAKRIQKEKQNAQSSTYVWIGIFAFLFGLFLIDRRNEHKFSRTLRGAIGDLIVKFKSTKRIRGELREKIEVQQPALSSKNNVFDHEKTYIDALPETQDSIKQQIVLPEEIKSDTPSPDFKGVFEIKQTKCKHKINKKSKSKLKGRLLGKGSDGQEADPSGEGEGSGLMEDNSFEKSGETEDYKNVENLE